jgi:hypothetical protein
MLLAIWRQSDIGAHTLIDLFSMLVPIPATQLNKPLGSIKNHDGKESNAQD